MRTIGGFIGREKHDKKNSNYHHTLALSTGRSCLKYIIKTENINEILIPFYICKSIIETLISNNVKYKYYSINKKLEIKNFTNTIKPNQWLLCVNYFGIKDKYINQLLKKLNSNRIIIDNSQAFFTKNPSSHWSFNSARKFFGVSDGAYVNGPNLISSDGEITKATYNSDHLQSRNQNNPNTLYSLFCSHENKLDDSILKISNKSQKTLNSIDYDSVANTRIKNYNYLHKHLSHINQFDASLEIDSVPNYYPFLYKKRIHEQLIEKGLFTPTFWKECNSISNDDYHFESRLSLNLAPLAIDQRYNIDTMNKIIKTVKEIDFSER